MIAAVLYLPYESSTDPFPLLWWFYKLVDSFPPDDIVFICDSDGYFADPAKHLGYHAIREDSQKIYSYNIPLLQSLSKYKKIVFDPFSGKDFKDYNDTFSYRKDSMRNRQEGLEYALEKALSHISNDGITIDCVLCWGDIPSIKAVCRKTSVPYVSTELGPFRNWTYSNCGLFSLDGILESCEQRYEIFLAEKDDIKTQIPLYSQAEIMALMLEDGFEQALEPYEPEYEMGIALPYSGVLPEEYSRLLEYAHSFPGSVLVRPHPTDVDSKEIYGVEIDTSDNSLEFIKKCKRVASVNSNTSVEALLLNKIVFTIGEASHSWLAHKQITNTQLPSCSLEKFNFYIFAGLVPLEFCFNKDYILWRLSNPTEAEIYQKNLSYWSFERIKRLLPLKSKVNENNRELTLLHDAHNARQADVEALSLQLRTMHEKMDAQYEDLTDRLLKSQSDVVRAQKAHIDAQEKYMRLEQEFLEEQSISGELREKSVRLELELLQSQQNLSEAKAYFEEVKNELTVSKNELTVSENLLSTEHSLLLDTQALLSQTQQDLINALGHVELLLPADRELTALKKTWFYRFASFPRRVLFPQGTKRRFVLRLIKVSFRHPILTLKNFRPSKIKNLMKITSNGEYGRANEIVSLKLSANQPLDAKIDVEAVKNTKDYESFSFPDYSKPLISIIIPVYNQFSYTYACLKSILNNTSIPYEVIIADDCSNDQTNKIGEIVSNVVHIRNERNLRFLLNCNNAAKYAKGEYLFFLNNDTQVQPEWLEPLVAIMKNDETIGLAGSKLVYPDGRLQEAGGILWQDGSAWNYGRFENPENPEYNYVKDSDYISGAAIMVRKKVWDKLGGFDERFAPAYYEDTDLAFAVRSLGYRTVYQPKSVVVHFEGISNGTDTSAGQKQYQIDNAEKFLTKWKSVLEKDHFPNAENVFQARDRSRYKKTILFIDHYVPMFDKDAGSRNTFSYVKLFVEMGYHVLFLGDNFFPHQPYTDVLQQMGVEVLYGVWYKDNWKSWLTLNGTKIDYVYMNRPHISEKYIDSIKKHTKAKIIYHGVDLHCARLRAQYEVEKDVSLLKEADDWEKRERKLFSQSDIMLTVSEKEKPIIEKMEPGKPVIVLPILFFDDFPDIKPFSSRKDILFVGGFAHNPNVDGVLWFAREVLPLLPSVKFIIVGSNPPEKIQKLANENIVVKGFVSDEDLAELYSHCRVAVAPLRFGAGVKGKTIEAMHNLIPLVSTSFGIEGLPKLDEIVPPCDEAADFAKEISIFLDSDDACHKAAEKYKEWLKKWFSTKRAVEVINEMTKK